MKEFRFWAVLLPVSLFLLSSCGEKEEPSPSESEVPEETGAVEEEEIVEPPVKGLSPEERAAMLGFAAHLPQDTQMLLSVLDGKGLVDSFRKLKGWQLAREIIEEEEGMDPEEAMAEGGEMVGDILGHELFWAFGADADKQVGVYSEFNSGMTYYQMRVLTQMFVQEALGTGDGGMSFDDDDAWMEAMAADFGKYMHLLETVQMPPILMGVRIPNEDTLGMAEEEMRSMLGFLTSEGEVVEFEKAGALFSGLLFKGELLSDSLEVDREEMDEMMGEATTDQVIEEISKKRLVMAIGRKDDYLLLYLGKSVEDCPLVESIEESMVASDAMAFIDEFGDQNVHLVSYTSKEMAEASVVEQISSIAQGVSDGLKASEELGDTRELVTMLDLVGEHENALLEMFHPEASGTVLWMDDGVKFEVIGGGAAPYLDYESPLSMNSLGDLDDVLFFSNYKADAKYAERSNEMIELLVEIAHAFGVQLAGLDLESDELDQFKEYFGMYEDVFHKDLVDLWDGISTMSEGLGMESALVVDMKAEFPPILGVPAEVVEEASFLRAAAVAPVKDRSKLGESWTKVDAAARGILESVRDAGLADIHMLKPTSSEKNDLVTWYFDGLAFSDDLKPSVTINDDWFVASTSRNQALELTERLAQDPSGVRQGWWMSLDLDVLRAYLKETAELVDKQGEVIFPDEMDLEDYREMLPKILKGIEAMEDVEAVTIEDRLVRGQRRMTLHLNAR